MKKIIKHEDKGIVQITIADERWYVRTPDGGGPEEFVPSVTWISSYYPKGIGYMKWLAEHGWDESEALKNAAAEKGSKIHQAICDLLDGKEAGMDASYKNPTTGGLEPLTLEEYEAVMSFLEWHKEAKPTTLAREIVVWNDQDKYAGTLDWIGLLCEEYAKKMKINQLCLTDWKSSQYIWPSHEIQVSAYKRALIGKELFSLIAPGKIEFEKASLAILRLGYRMNKKKFVFTPIEDKYGLFLAAKEIWKNETAGISPLKKDYPITLTLMADCPDCRGSGSIATQGIKPDDIQQEMCPKCNGTGKTIGGI